MTEEQMLAELLALNTAHDTLLARVQALEGLALPKREYFNQLQAAFADSPDCNTCVEGTCVCPPEVP